MINKLDEHCYEADNDTPLKELKKAGWTSSVKISRREDIWATAMLKEDIVGLTGAGIDILWIHDGPGRKYHYREEQVIPILKQLQEYLKEHNITWIGAPNHRLHLRNFWRKNAV